MKFLVAGSAAVEYFPVFLMLQFHIVSKTIEREREKILSNLLSFGWSGHV